MEEEKITTHTIQQNGSEGEVSNTVTTSNREVAVPKQSESWQAVRCVLDLDDRLMIICTQLRAGFKSPTMLHAS